MYASATEGKHNKISDQNNAWQQHIIDVYQLIVINVCSKMSFIWKFGAPMLSVDMITSLFGPFYAALLYKEFLICYHLEKDCAMLSTVGRKPLENWCNTDNVGMWVYTSPKLGVDSELFTDLRSKTRPEPGVGPTFWWEHLSSQTRSPTASSCVPLSFLVACLSISQSCTGSLLAPSASEKKKAEWVNEAQWLSSLCSITITTTSLYCAVLSALLYIAITRQTKSNNKSIS